jgi:hypothetical protein
MIEPENLVEAYRLRLGLQVQDAILKAKIDPTTVASLYMEASIILAMLLKEPKEVAEDLRRAADLIDAEQKGKPN